MPINYRSATHRPCRRCHPMLPGLPVGLFTRRTNGAYASTCRDCSNLIERERRAVAAAARPDRPDRIDWSAPPATMTCKQCRSEYPTERFPRAGRGRRRWCRPCESKRELVRQAEERAAKPPPPREQRPQVYVARPTTWTSAMTEAKVDPKLYVTALQSFWLAAAPIEEEADA